MNATKLPRWGQALSGAILLGIAVTAGVTGLTLNVSHGLQTGVATGLMFGLADVGKIVIPIVAGVIGWSRQLRLTAVICVAVSLWCAVNFYAGRQGQHHADQTHSAATYADAEARIAEMQAHAASLASLATLEGKKGGCGPNCRDLMTKATEAAQKVQEARAARATMKPVEVAANSDIKATIETGLFLALIEVLVWLSVPAMTLLGQAMRPTCKESLQVPVVKKSRKPRKAVWTKKASDKMLADVLRTGFRFKKDGTPDRRYKHAKRVTA